MYLPAKIAADWPTDRWCEVSVLAAVSGGADSVAMLRALAQLKQQAGGPGSLVVAHFDHGLRAESAADASFVRELASKLQLPCEIGHGDVAGHAAAEGDGMEAAARTARYDFFEQAAARHGARYIVTAHTADDVAETVLLNVLRGTGLAGLAGIPRVRQLNEAVTIVRPMLAVHRGEVLEYLASLGQDFRHDASNDSADFARNRIRHEVLPLLRARLPGDIDAALARTAKLAGEAQAILERLARALLETACQLCEPPPEGTVYVNVAPLMTQDRHLVREVFVSLWRREQWPQQDMRFAHWEALAEMALAEWATFTNGTAKTRDFPGRIHVMRQQHRLILSPTK